MIIPTGAWGASAANPAWSAEGTRWDVPAPELAESEIDRFNSLWTARFADSNGLQAYLDRPGLYEDGFNALDDDAKAFLIVNLIRHWQSTIPGFGRDLWTGETEADQKSFGELAVMLYATIFAKDEFLASMRAPPATMGPVPPVPVETDAGIAEYPGMSQGEITAYFDGLHATNTIVTARPASPDLGLAPHLVPDQTITNVAPPMIGATSVPAAIAPLPFQQPPTVATEDATITPPARFRGEASVSVPTDPTQLSVSLPTLEDLLAFVPLDGLQVAPPEPGMLLNTVAAGTYLACGSVGTGAVQCAPAPVPLGTPVLLDLDGDLLTGVAGQEVSVLLGPTVHPDYALGGFSAELRVDRTEPSALPTTLPLAAQVYVVYTIPQAATQVLAGFDARDDTLGDTQSARVTIKDVALALAGDVQILGEITRAGPGSHITLTAGFAQIDPIVFPPVPMDPMTLALRFEPAPESFVADLRFAEVLGQSVIEGAVSASLSPTVTATIRMEQGDELRTLVGIVESMPTELSFNIVSEAVGAVGLEYQANAPFPRFELHDVLIYDVNAPAARSTLDAVVHDVPASISFDIDHPFQVSYQASDIVSDATIVIEQFDANGLATSMGAHVEGIPSSWSLTGTTSPVALQYVASGNIALIDAALYDRDATLAAAAHVEDIPDQLTLILSDEQLLASASQPIGLIEAWMSVDGLAPAVIAGEFASFRSDGADGLAAAARVLGFTSLDIDQTVADQLSADLVIAGGEPFTAIVDTPEAYVVATLSNLPTAIHLELTPGMFTYDLAQPVTQLSIHAELADLVADVAVLGLPDELAISWTTTSLVWNANAPVTGLIATIQRTGILATANVQSIPADFTVAWPSGTATFSTPTAVGSILVQASVNGGSLISVGGDHATFRKVGSAMGVSLRISGVRAFSIDPRNGGAYSLTLAPGGQPFLVYAIVDDITAIASVSNLPTTIGIDLRPGTQSFGYTAASPISQVWAYAESSTTPLYAYVNLEGLPSTVALTWTSGTAPTIVYDSSGSLTSAYAFVRTSTGAAFEGSITGLPPYLRIVGNPNDIVVDARSSATAGAGTGTVGAINARYGSDGSFMGGSGNHANLYQTATITRASIGYSGLQYLRVGQANDNLIVDVRNSAPRYFTVLADTPEAFATLAIDSIPARVLVTGYGGSLFTYNAFGQTIDEIAVHFWDRASNAVDISIRDIPGSATISLNLPNKSMTYWASSAIGAIDVDAWIGVWYGKLRITSVPTYWTTSFGNGVYSFDAYPQFIGSVEAAVTNHGTWSSLSGNHLRLTYVASPETVDASLKMTQVQRALYSRTGTNQNFDLRMGGSGTTNPPNEVSRSAGSPFTVLIDATLATTEKAYAYAAFTPLPSSIQATIGEKTTVNTNQNFDTYIYGHFGTQAALNNAPSPPYVHGISVRDGASGTQRAIKGSLYLTGLPTSVVFDGRNGTFGFTNWRPSLSYLIADAELDNFVPAPVDIYVSQSGIPNPQSLTFTMSTKDIGSGSKRTKVDIVQTAAMGALFADMIYAGQHGRLQVSNIPDDIHATFTLANGQTTFAWDATAAISSIYAGFRVVAQSGSFQGYLSLTDIPSDFTLVFGRASGGQGPTMTYNANANTLDVTAYTDASLFGGDLKARLSFGLVNLGRDVDIFVSGSGVRFTSTPATSSVHTAVWANYNYYQANSGTWDAGGFLEYPWAYHVGVNPNINNFQVTLTNFSDFSLAWGVTSKISGSYGSFSFGWDSFTVNLHAYGKVQISVDWPWPFGSSTINLVNVHYHPPTINVNVLFHKYDNHQSTWFGTSGWAICDWSLSATIKPHPHGATWNGVSTTAASASGGAWYVTPNPWGVLPGWGIDLVARYTSPDGGSGPGLNFDFDCI